MSLISRLRKASFRGIEFATPGHERDFGRDVKRQKIINGDDVYYEDVGAKETVFTVEAVIGGRASFIEDADAFEEALSRIGPGRLILPDSKELNVVVMSARRRSSSDEAGIVYFTITFDKVGQDKAASGAFISKIPSASGLMNTALLDDFTRNFSTNLPDFVRSSLQEHITAVTGFITPALGKQGIDFALDALDFSDALGLVKSVQNSFSRISSVFSPKVNYTVGLNTPAAASSINGQTIIQTLTSAANVNADDTASSPAASQSLRALNGAAIDLAFKTTALNTAASILPFVEFESKNQALEVRRTVLEGMAKTRANAGERRWHKTYTAMSSVMAAVNTQIDEVLGALPRTIQIRPQVTRSSTLLAYRLYGANKARVLPMAADIVSRNRIVHPSFLTPDALEVLADV